MRFNPSGFGGIVYYKVQTEIIDVGEFEPASFTRRALHNIARDGSAALIA